MNIKLAGSMFKHDCLFIFEHNSSTHMNFISTEDYASAMGVYTTMLRHAFMKDDDNNLGMSCSCCVLILA